MDRGPGSRATSACADEKERRNGIMNAIKALLDRGFIIDHSPFDYH
jgi:hypothetical protein